MIKGILGTSTRPVRIITLLAGSALIALAAPVAANATTTVEAYGAQYVDIEGDSGAQNLTLTVASSTLTVSGSDVTAGIGCTGSAPTVTCAGLSTTSMYLDAYLYGGSDVLTASALPASYSLYAEAGTGSDKILGGAGIDHIYFDDGEIDAVGSSCGAGIDYVYKDSFDPAVNADCESVQTYTYLSFNGSPSITGTPKIGSPLGVGNVSVSGGSYSLSYYWYTCATATSGCGDTVSQAATYTPTAADAGKFVFVDVEANPSDGSCCGDYQTAGPVQIPIPPSSAFTFGAFKSGKLAVFVPGPGVLTAGPVLGTASAAKKKKKKKKSKALIAKTKLTVNKSGIFSLPVKLTSAGKKQNKKKKIKAKVLVTFTPSGGTPASQVATVTFKKKKKKK